MIQEQPAAQESTADAQTVEVGSEGALIADLTARLEQAEKAAAASRDQHLRVVAELDNVRKRAQREIDNGVKYGTERLLGDLLGICDSLELGLKAATAPEATVKAIADGLVLTHKQLISMLEKHGVKQVDPKGEVFNPDFHEAVAAIDAPQVPPNHVVDVMQKGYRFHERTLRPAMVVVAKNTAS